MSVPRTHLEKMLTYEALEGSRGKREPERTRGRWQFSEMAEPSGRGQEETLSFMQRCDPKVSLEREALGRAEQWVLDLRP